LGETHLSGFWSGVTAIELFVVFVVAFRLAPDGDEIEQFSRDVWARYTVNVNDAASGERAIGYIYRDIDRQINKARGVLTFDALFLAVVRTYYITPDEAKLKAALGDFLGTLFFYNPTCFLVVAILVCLYLFLVRWGNISRYGSFQTEFEDAAHTTRWRTIWLHFAIYLSGLSAVLIVVELLYIVRP
jgi:hypothetical protein